MAITSVQPCDKNGNVITRPYAYKIPKGKTPVISDDFPCILVTCNSASSFSYTYSIRNFFDSDGSASPVTTSATHSLSAGTTVIPLAVTWEMIAAWQSARLSSYTDTTNYALLVDFTYGSYGSETIRYRVYASDLADWINERGWPSFIDDQTYLVRSTSTSSGWIDDDDGPNVRAMVAVKRPAHFPWYVRVSISAYDRYNGTTTTKVSNQARAQIISYRDSNTSTDSTQGFVPIYNPQGIVKVVYKLQYSTKSDFASYYELETVTLYKSMLEPLITATGTGGLELSTIAKTAILDFIYPSGSMIFATSYNSLQQRIRSMPGTWSIASAYWEIDTSAGTMQVYTATRTA